THQSCMGRVREQPEGALLLINASRPQASWRARRNMAAADLGDGTNLQTNCRGEGPMISWLCQTAARIRSLFMGSRMDRDLDHELDTHIAMLTEEGVQRGLPPDVARREARIRVGSRGALHEIHRDARSSRIINDFFRDVRHSVRLFRRTPLFTLVAVVSL